MWFPGPTVQSHTRGPNVGLVCVRLVTTKLRACVQRRAVERVNEFGRACDASRDAEISELHDDLFDFSESFVRGEHGASVPRESLSGQDVRIDHASSDRFSRAGRCWSF